MKKSCDPVGHFAAGIGGEENIVADIDKIPSRQNGMEQFSAQPVDFDGFTACRRRERRITMRRKKGINPLLLPGRELNGKTFHPNAGT